jgi:hypothetical protein
MKLRIRANSLRIRLTKSEVNAICDTGYLEEQTSFAGNKFLYALQSVDEATQLSATLVTNKITMFVPRQLIKGWKENNVVGFHSDMPVSGNDVLNLLLEKDFVCLDDVKEDQADNYDNPGKTC